MSRDVVTLQPVLAGRAGWAALPRAEILCQWQVQCGPWGLPSTATAGVRGKVKRLAPEKPQASET